MIQYRLLFISAAFLLSPCITAAESAEAPKQDTSSGAIHRHHEHSADSALRDNGPTASEGENSSQPKISSGMESHHHHKPAAEVKAQPKLPAEKKGEQPHHMMNMGEHHMNMDEGGETQPQSPAEKKGEHLHHMMKMDMGEHHMDMDVGGMVMNENKDVIPRDCPELAGDVEITVRAGVKYAKKFPGTVFGYDKHEWNVKPCTRITVTFINEDDVRHQWMVHMLPKYIYPKGMFHLEVSGPGRRTGTFIVPSVEKTYFVHCDIAQHTEKGMKAQLKVGGGDQDFPSIPGITAPNFPDSYGNEKEISWSTIASSVGAGVIGFALAIIGLGRAKRKAEAKDKEASRVQAPVPTPTTKQQKGWLFGRK